jgi:hypothetical protein
MPDTFDICSGRHARSAAATIVDAQGLHMVDRTIEVVPFEMLDREYNLSPASRQQFHMVAMCGADAVELFLLLPLED